MGVFAGGCTPDAVAAVRGGEDAALARLVGASLVQQLPDTQPPGYAMLETLRKYAVEQLATARDLQHYHHRHAAFFTTLAEQAEPHLRGAQQREWMEQLEREHNNLRVALRRSSCSKKV